MIPQCRDMGSQLRDRGARIKTGRHAALWTHCTTRLVEVEMPTHPPVECRPWCHDEGDWGLRAAHAQTQTLRCGEHGGGMVTGDPSRPGTKEKRLGLTPTGGILGFGARRLAQATAGQAGRRAV